MRLCHSSQRHDRFTCTSANVIYCITCTLCKKLYIGETGRRLGNRFREHLQSLTVVNLHLSTLLIIPNFTNSPPTQHHSFFRNYLFISCRVSLRSTARAFKALANGFNICFNIHSILLNAVERLLNDVERGMSKRFQHFIQQNLASGLVNSFRPQLFSRLRHARAPF